MSTSELIQQALDKDYNKANEIFGELMSAKVNDLLDQEKIKLADQIYNGAEPDEEQLELDLEDEDEDTQAPEENSEVGDEGVSEPDSEAELEVGDEDDDDQES